MHQSPDVTPEELRQEALSALWDHELSELEARRHKDSLPLDENDKARLARYALIGAAMRQADSAPLMATGFLAGINARLDAEGQQPVALVVHADTQNLDTDSSFQPSLKERAAKGTAAGLYAKAGKLVLGSAIAASVALLLVTGVTRYQTGPSGEQPLLALAPAEPPMQQPLALASTTVEPEQKLSPDMERRLNRYLVSHGEYARGQGVGQMLPSVSLVSYGSKP